MIPQKLFLIPILFLFMGFTLHPNRSGVTKWVISSGGTLKVAGSTNVNKFSCVIADYSNPDTLSFSKNNSEGSVKLSGVLNLQVEDFNCHNQMMTRDLRKTLKYKDYPTLIIRFVSLSHYPDLGKPSDSFDGVVFIEIAGVRKQFTIDYKFAAGSAKYLSLTGSRVVKFSDFNIKPPKKAGGIIQTNDNLSVEFNLRVRILD